MNILVTGGAGYIGSVMAPILLQAGHRVTVLDNFLYNQSSLLDVCHNDALTIVRGDVRDTALLRKLVAKADALFPLACLVGAPLCDKMPVEARSINHDAVKALIEFSAPSQRIIFPTTNSGWAQLVPGRTGAPGGRGH